MQRRFYTLVLLLLCTLAGPSVLKAQTPTEFNDKLVAITEGLYSKGQEWGKQFNAAYEAKDFTSLTNKRQQLEQFVTQKLAEVKAMKDVKDSKTLREAMVNFLEFEKGMIDRAFKPMESLGKNPSQEQVKAAYDQLTTYSKEEQVALERVNKAQEAYAKANGFTIAQPELVEEAK